MTNRPSKKKYSNQKGGKFQKKFIKQLRQDVEDTCNAISPERFFEFTASKENVAYKELQELLAKDGLPIPSESTLRNFFHNKPEPVGRHEVFAFSERTIQILKDFVQKHISSRFAAGRQKTHDPFITIDKPLRDYLYDQYFLFRGALDINEVINVQSDGTHRTSYNVLHFASTPFTHFFFMPTKPQKLVSYDCLDEDEQVLLNVYQYKFESGVKEFIFIFPKPKQRGSVSKYYLIGKYEDVFKELLDNRTLRYILFQRSPYRLYQNRHQFFFNDKIAYKGVKAFLHSLHSVTDEVVELETVEQDSYYFIDIPLHKYPQFEDMAEVKFYLPPYKELNKSS